jgi:tetratricopeptide (TPR) repeat protein
MGVYRFPRRLQGVVMGLVCALALSACGSVRHALHLEPQWRSEYRAGLEAFNRQQWAEAIRHLMEAERLRPENQPGYAPDVYLAVALVEVGRRDEAQRYFARAAEPLRSSDPRLAQLTQMAFKLLTAGDARDLALSAERVEATRPAEEIRFAEEARAANAQRQVPPVQPAGPPKDERAARSEDIHYSANPIVVTRPDRRERVTLSRSTASELSDDAQSAAQRQFDEAQRFVASLHEAAAAFHAPPVVELAEPFVAELVVSPKQSIQGLLADVMTQAPSDAVRVGAAKLGPRMEAAFSCQPDCQVNLNGPQDRLATGTENVTWQWNVVASHDGPVVLTAKLFALTSIDGTPYFIKSFEASIRVHVRPMKRATRFVKDNWQWLWAAGPPAVLGGTWWTKRKKRRHSRKN